MSDEQLRACREAFEKHAVTRLWAIHRNGGEQYVNTATQHSWQGWLACWNTRAHEGGEAVAWMKVEREYHEYENSAMEDNVGYLVTRYSATKPLNAEGWIALYTHPPRAQSAGDDARDAARYRWLRRVDADVPRELDVVDHLGYVYEGINLDKAIDADQSERGETEHG